MKASWTISRLLREHPQCRKVLRAYDLVPREISGQTLATIAEEIEEDIDDFLDELDEAANSLSEYDADVHEDDDDMPDTDDDEYEAGVTEPVEEEAVEEEDALDESLPFDDEDDDLAEDGGDDDLDEDEEVDEFAL